MFDAFEPSEEATERAGRRVALLAELAEIGMTLARGLRDEVAGGEARTEDPALAFSRLSRAIRLTVMLEARCDEDHRTAEAAWNRRLDLRRSLSVVGGRDATVATRTAETEAPERGAEFERERLREDAEERLDVDEAPRVADEAIPERIARICKLLGATYTPTPAADWPAGAERPDHGRYGADPPS